jgi:hypothetical protein
MANIPTWRNIAGPSFNGSFINTAANTFSNVTDNSLAIADSLFATQDRIDERYTNAAVLDALRTGRVDPNLNPRANANTVYDALYGKQEHESLLETEQAERDNIGSQIDLRNEQISDYSWKNSEAFRNLYERNLTSEADANAAALAYDTWALQQGQRQDAQAMKDSEDVERLAYELTGIGQRAYQQALREMVPEGQEATEAQKVEARIRAEEAKESPEARQFLEDFRFKNKISQAAWDRSAHGRQDILGEAAKAEIVTARRIREEANLDANDAMIRGFDNGDFSKGRVDRFGRLVPLTEAYKDIEAMGSYDEAMSKLQRFGINVDKLSAAKSDSRERRVMGIARQTFKTASLLASTIEPYIGDDGEFDADEYMDLLDDVGGLGIQNGINQARISSNLSPLDWGVPGNSDITAAELLKDTNATPAVKSAYSGIALKALPSNIRDEAAELLASDSDARSIIASELTKAAVSSPIDKANLFITLLKAYLGKTSESEPTAATDKE